MAIEKLDLYIGMSIAGIFTGLGSALGNWIANQHIIKSIDELKKKMRKVDIVKKTV
jgi:hypothetical protein